MRAHFLIAYVYIYFVYKFDILNHGGFLIAIRGVVEVRNLHALKH